jgi:hypothetical protein
MNIYVVFPITDNPLFEGLSLATYPEVLNTWPKDWRKRITSWESKLFGLDWVTPKVEGNLRLFNDYPCINLTFPAFSQRAIDILGESLRLDGELLPLRHELGTYYFYNITRIVSVFSRTHVNNMRSDISNAEIDDTSQYSLDGVMLFKDRCYPSYQMCTQSFVDAVCANNLNGFIFVPLWPRREDVTFHTEWNRLSTLSKKLKSHNTSSIDVDANTIAIRLICKGRRASSAEKQSAEEIAVLFERLLYDPNQCDPAEYYGNVEGVDFLDHEIRIYLTTPDCDLLLQRLRTTLSALPWGGPFYVLKRRGHILDSMVPEEYVRV